MADEILTPLTETEKVRARKHMGYVSAKERPIISLGLPSVSPTQSSFEAILNEIPQAALPEIRMHLDLLDGIQKQGLDDLELLAVTGVGSIAIASDEQKKLREQYDYYVAELSNLLGVSRNPYDVRLQVGSINVSVMH